MALAVSSPKAAARCGRVRKYAICLTLAALVGAAGWWLHLRLDHGRRDLDEWLENTHRYSATEAADSLERIARRMGVAYYALSAEEKASAYWQLWGKFFMEGDYARAFEVFRKANELAPRPLIHLQAYLAALAKKADWLRCLTQEPPADCSPEDLTFFKACLAWAVGKPSEVLEITAECPRGAEENESPSNALLWLYFLRARALMQIGRDEDGLELLDNHVAPSGERMNTMTGDPAIALHIALVGAEAAEKCGQYRHALAIAQVVAWGMDKFIEKSWDASRQELRETIRRLEERVHASEVK